MAANSNSSLRNLTLLGGVSALFLVALAAAFSWMAWESEKTAQSRQLSELAEFGAASLDAYFQSVEFELRELSQDVDEAHGRGRPERARPPLARSRQPHAELRGISVTRMDGQALAAETAADETLSAALPSFIQTHEEGPDEQTLGIGRAFLGQASKEWVIPVAYALRDKRGDRRYLVYATVPLAEPQRFWKNAPLPDGVALGLQRDDGNPARARPDPESAGSERGYAAGTGALFNLVRSPDYPVAGTPDAARPGDADRALTVFRRLAHYPYAVYASAAPSMLTAAWWDKMRFPWLVLGLLLAGGGLAWGGARRRQFAWDAQREQEAREARDLNQELARRLDELEATKLEIEAFNDCVRHDLRAPLRGIDGFATQLRKEHGEQLGGAGRACLDRIGAASQKMGSAIDEILKLSETDLRTFQRDRVNLSALAREVVADLESGGLRPGVGWVIPEGIKAEGDVRLLRLVLHNLLGNALKSTRGHATARIEFGVWPERRDGRPVYFVKDDGVGFNMKYAGKLFRAFQRLHTEEEFPGQGIGLATAQRIVRRHRGQIWAEAAPDQGAIFYFTLG